jgi:rhodanese-related sulfurtransferase
MQFLLDNWMIVAVMFTSGAMLLWPLVQRRVSPVKDVGTFNVTHMINHRDALLVDVRDPKEYEAGRIPNALNIPLAQLAGRSDELARHTARPVIAYCARGNRSRSAGSTLQKLGFAEIYSLSGGFQAWKSAGLPVEK